ncbi:MAG: hypothetical protein EPO19_14570 [Betaproteobacteria bacterium]|nr:MAG: hypothetical protein EPO19_14570 [Betaproteobacteria bacterium]
MAQTDREVLFANESFLVGVLQAVSGGSVVGGLSQAETIIRFAGKLPYLFFLTAMIVALLAAVLAAYWKHDYKMWDVKGHAAAKKGEPERARSHIELAGSDLWQMRWSMRTALFAILLGFTVLVAAFWYRGL